MSSSINIPRRSAAHQLSARKSGKQPVTDDTISPSSSSNSSAGSFSQHPQRMATEPAAAAPLTPAGGGSPSSPREEFSPRRASLLSSSLSKTEHIVVDVGDPSGTPRLISCVSSSQGFDWNRSIFLPRYLAGMDDDALELEHRQDPIEDIVLTDEEVRDMLPQ